MSSRGIYRPEDADRFYKKSAGNAYRPSNGTEGDIFQRAWCADCGKDNFNIDTGDGGCPIIAYTMAIDASHPDYPKAWRYSESGQPECTEFEERS